MHPIERLRAVARSTAAPQDLLIVESARALAAFDGQPAALVTGCRRVISRQVTAGGLWWLCSSMLCAPDPRAEAWRLSELVEEDQTSRQLARLLPTDARLAMVGRPFEVLDALIRRGEGTNLVVDTAGDGYSMVRYLNDYDVEAFDVPAAGLGAAASSADVVVIEAQAMSQREVLASAGSLALASVARQCGVEVWLSVGIGRVLPDRVWDGLVARWDVFDEPWDSTDEIVPLDLIDVVVSSTGRHVGTEVGSLIDCPIAPELFRRDIT